MSLRHRRKSDERADRLASSLDEVLRIVDEHVGEIANASLSEAIVRARELLARYQSDSGMRPQPVQVPELPDGAIEVLRVAIDREARVLVAVDLAQSHAKAWGIVLSQVARQIGKQLAERDGTDAGKIILHVVQAFLAAFSLVPGVLEEAAEASARKEVVEASKS